MKKSILLFIALFAIFTTYAQEEETNDLQRKHEVRLNAAYLIAGAFEGSYSYILNDESAVGISVLLPLDEQARDDVNYLITPYYRLFFGKKEAAGFFIEGFGMLNSLVENELFTEISGTDPTITVTDYRDKNVTDFALGIGIGGKWMTKKGLIGEIHLGVGRNLFNASDDTDFVGRAGVSIGYRF